MLGSKQCSEWKQEVKSLGRHALSCRVRREDPDELFQELSILVEEEATDPAVRSTV